MIVCTSEVAMELKQGTVLVSLHRRLPSPGLHLLDFRLVPHIWGDLPCFIMQRREDDRNRLLPASPISILQSSVKRSRPGKAA